MIGKNIAVIASFSPKGEVRPLYAKVWTPEGYQDVKILKVNPIQTKEPYGSDRLFFRCLYGDDRGMYHEIKLRFWGHDKFQWSLIEGDV